MYLLNVNGADRRLMIFTEESMLKHFDKEQKSGRFPPEIELLLTPLPEHICSQVLAAREVASAETSPKREDHVL